MASIKILQSQYMDDNEIHGDGKIAIFLMPKWNYLKEMAGGEGIRWEA